MAVSYTHLEDHSCMTHDLWTTLNEKMYEYLANVTLEDLAAKQRKSPIGGSISADQRRAGVNRPVRERLAASA